MVRARCNIKEHLFAFNPIYRHLYVNAVKKLGMKKNYPSMV